jgi:hypothetical protein
VIQPEFPETAPEKGLLSPALLNEFVQKRPKTKDDWFRRIPHDLRTNVDSRQVGRYLDRILQMVSESDERALENEQ